jgi:hypothetical protein
MGEGWGGVLDWEWIDNCDRQNESKEGFFSERKLSSKVGSERGNDRRAS